jgi:hemerythrin-like domain-containing protein
MNLTSQLREEHLSILKMAEILDRMASMADVGEQLSTRDMESIHKLLVTFADRCHHGKEEVVLFPALAGHRDIVADLLREHVLGRRQVRAMGKAIAESSSGDVSAERSFADHARKYSRLIRAHIEKEDNHAFPLAERELSEERKAVLLEQFEEIEEKRIGAGGHRQLAESLDDLYGRFIISP